ncbi:GNAT family N-acetyltransferase [Candidatus Bipolaricaulota bacterium]|nr:GNAT family N-acetyltransferase [Candidatus Bipolaricaulota bacterium]
MHIRELTLEDYDALVEIWTQAGLSYRPFGRDGKEYLQSEIGRDTAVFLGAEVDGVLVGVVLGTHDGRKGWINRLAVLPDHRKRGIGKALVMETEQRLNKLGIKIVTCLIESGNDSSEGFFESLGYIRHPEITYFSKRQSSDW